MDEKIENGIAEVYGNVKQKLNALKIEFEPLMVIAVIRERVISEVAKNPKAFEFHDIDSAAHIANYIIDTAILIDQMNENLKIKIP